MIGEISKELISLKDINETTSDQILILTPRVETKKVQKEMLDHRREDTVFDI